MVCNCGRAAESQPGRNPAVLQNYLQRLFAEHFRDEENKKGSPQTAAEEKINQGKTSRGKHGGNDSDHRFNWLSRFLVQTVLHFVLKFQRDDLG
jgi:hypothetical protein